MLRAIFKGAHFKNDPLVVVHPPPHTCAIEASVSKLSRIRSDNPGLDLSWVNDERVSDPLSLRLTWSSDIQQLGIRGKDKVVDAAVTAILTPSLTDPVHENAPSVHDSDAESQASSTTSKSSKRRRVILS